MIKGVINILESDTDVSTTTSDRIYPVLTPQDTAYPSISVDLEDIEPSDTKASASKLDYGTIVVTSFSKTYPECKTLSEYVRTALDRVAEGTYNGDKIQSIRFESQFEDSEFPDGMPDLFYIEQTYTVRHDKT